MINEVQLCEVLEEQKSVLRQLIELYEYDFSEFNNNDVNQYGYYGYSYFDHYWLEPGRVPFFILVNGNLAGFILVNSFCYCLKEENSRSISEFFIMRKYRKQGVGIKAAHMVFNLMPGHWEVLQHPENHTSHHFWNRAIDSYTNGQFNIEAGETEDWVGQAILFKNSQLSKKD
ncbi:Predicted acetyltransferase [Paenibacillus uliginis N3/975]|uniref:Predicted acetyltransferase n=1 Tax=Paenibacillus uliginis N3/975 TaxID=1313296 RepID=A0A1X7GYZ9_9BACL|nr:GNAT family N-acetyltransferase [Paenibacillus uliginis]SMF76953.1 Predicted acetyltransferase [Paenibacillus uliginis N3/975]